jgi:hypothetical protein
VGSTDLNSDRNYVFASIPFDPMPRSRHTLITNRHFVHFAIAFPEARIVQSIAIKSLIGSMYQIRTAFLEFGNPAVSAQQLPEPVVPKGEFGNRDRRA